MDEGGAAKDNIYQRSVDGLIVDRVNRTKGLCRYESCELSASVGCVD